METANERIKQLRQRLNLSQEVFGQAIGLTKSGISNIENGRRKVSDRHLKLISAAFDVSEGWLQFGIDENQLITEIIQIEAWSAFLKLIGYAVNYQAAGDEEVIITVKKSGKEHDFTSAEFQAFQAEIKQSVEYQLWKKNRKDK